jgi:hypothetical protein
VVPFGWRAGTTVARTDLTVKVPSDASVGLAGRVSWSEARDAAHATAHHFFDEEGTRYGISNSSNLTWNVVLMGQLKVAKRVGLLLGYRWFDIDYENLDDLFVMEIREAGPMLAISYSFH